MLPPRDARVCVTAQHREMLDQVLSLFDITPDVDLTLMRPGQDLTDPTNQILAELRKTLQAWRPDFVLVHGDTTTFASALAALYERMPVGHVEAGLRTGNIVVSLVPHRPFTRIPEKRLQEKILVNAAGLWR